MKKLTILVALTMLIASCKNESKREIKKEKFPEELGKVFQNHGGIENWRKARTLSFNKGEEAHTVDLKSRKTLINTPNYSMGYNGKEVWLSEKDSGTYKGNPSFYHNLFFYFYAMPFVLADDGIIYSEAKSISFEGKEFPGVKISYEANVGSSPDDNYIIYYNPENYQMEWLAYTVTFRSKKPSDRYNLIRYEEWKASDGFKFPKKITWYQKDENGQPTKPARPATEFTLPLVSKTALKDASFEKPIKE
ncbi:DUF6503 family protein [Pseudotenacibaculum sp. MALMAid0570]|uniref:DUF6503 family protein n=1 Tax=Pseudotenacibaculum sp. MALMAid0570 TaxID=3143938 RepID=UPI0032DF7442